MRIRIDGLTIVALALILFMGLNVLRDEGLVEAAPVDKVNAAAMSIVPIALEQQNGTSGLVSEAVQPEAMTTLPDLGEPDPDIIISPYDQYTLTQGPHGFSYGHMAIDITGGKLATIKSPISGVVTALYVDEWGNPTVIIENDHYQITMLHGIYTVTVGEEVEVGQSVGQESNQGNTVDALGRSCRGRDCGYHTHLNIYDKRLGVNVNPLEVLGN